MTKNQVETMIEPGLNPGSMTPQQLAEERVAAEEASRREERVAELQREEEGRRAQEARELAREEAQRLAGEEARKLAACRLEIEQAAEVKVAELVETLQALTSLDAEHRQALAASGRPVPTMLVGGLLYGWLSSVFKPLDIHLGMDPYDGVSLEERDTLTPVPPDSERYVAPEELERAERERAAKRAEHAELVRAGKARTMLANLKKTHARLRSEYKQPVSFERVTSRVGGWEGSVLTPEELAEARAEVEEPAE